VANPSVFAQVLAFAHRSIVSQTSARGQGGVRTPNKAAPFNRKGGKSMAASITGNRDDGEKVCVRDALLLVVEFYRPEKLEEAAAEIERRDANGGKNLDITWMARLLNDMGVALRRCKTTYADFAATADLLGRLNGSCDLIVHLGGHVYVVRSDGSGVFALCGEQETASYTADRVVPALAELEGVNIADAITMYSATVKPKAAGAGAGRRRPQRPLTKHCSECASSLPKDSFTGSQFAKKHPRRCKKCQGAAGTAAAAESPNKRAKIAVEVVVGEDVAEVVAEVGA